MPNLRFKTKKLFNIHQGWQQVRDVSNLTQLKAELDSQRDRKIELCSYYAPALKKEKEKKKKTLP